MADKPRSPFSASMFDNFKEKSESAMKSINDQTSKTEMKTATAAKGIARSYKEAAVNSAMDMKTFFLDVERSANDTSKNVADTARKMFTGVQIQQQQALKTTAANLKNVSGEFRRHLNEAQGDLDSLHAHQQKVSISTGELIGALTTKALGLHGALVKVQSVSARTSNSNSLVGKLAGDANSSLGRIDKAASFFSASELLGVIGSRGTSKVLESIAPAIEGIGGSLAKLAPQIAIISSAAGFISNLYDKLMQIDEVTTDLAKGVGGDKDFALKYYNRMVDLKSATFLTTGQLISLGKAFQQAGWRTMEGEHSVDKYLIVASKVSRITGVSNEQLAKYSYTMIAAGKTADDVYKSYDKMYGITQNMGLTFADLNSALSEGDSLWEKFGYLGGKSLDGIQTDMLKTKGLLKAFNVDIKDTASALSGLWGDEKTQRRQATFVASMLKMNARDAYNTQIVDLAQAQENMIRASMKYLASNKNAHFDMTTDQLNGLGSEGLYGAVQNQKMMLKTLTQHTGMDQKMASQLISDYRGYAQGHKGASIDQWIESRKEGLAGTGHQAGNLDTAVKTLNNSAKESMAFFGESLQTPVNKIAAMMDSGLPAITSNLNSISMSLNTLSSSGFNIPTPYISNAKMPVAQHSVPVSSGHSAPTVSPGAVHMTRQSGWLSSMFEGNVGSTAPAYRVDKNRHVYVLPGQAAYGSWQMDSGMGVPQKFMSFLKAHHNDTYRIFEPTLGTMGNHKGPFAQTWKAFAKSDPKNFLAMQKEFLMPNYLNPVVTAFPELKNSKTLQEVAFSTAIQHGPQSAINMFKKAGYGHTSNSQFIHKLYKMRSGIMSGDRYSREEKLAQDAMQREESSGSNRDLLQKNNELLSQAVHHLAEGNQTRKDTNQAIKRQVLGSAGSGTMSQSKAIRGSVV